MLTLKEILNHLEDNNECFQGTYVGWKNSVRHNLSTSDCFVKLLRDNYKPFGKDNFWAMNPDFADCRDTPLRCKPSLQSDVSASSAPLLSQKIVSPFRQHFTDQPVLSTTLPPNDTTIDSRPLDLSKSATLREGVYSSPKARSSVPPKLHNISPRNTRERLSDIPLCSQPVSSPTMSCENSSRTRNTLPISRFLNSPPRTTKEPVSWSVSSRSRSNNVDRNTGAPNSTTTCSVTSVSPCLVTQESTANARKPPVTPTSTTPRSATQRSTSTPPDPINPNSTSPESLIRPREGIPQTPDEWIIFKDLYEHYWNRALQERHALYNYHQHFTMLQDRNNKRGDLQEYQRLLSVNVPPEWSRGYLPQDSFMGHTPYSYPPLRR